MCPMHADVYVIASLRGVKRHFSKAVRKNKRFEKTLSRSTFLRSLRHFLARAAMLSAALGALLYAGDSTVFHLRAASNRNPYGSVMVTHYYAVLQKNGKTAFLFDPPAPQACVSALFPHAGLDPCWYLSRHPEQRTDI